MVRVQQHLPTRTVISDTCALTQGPWRAYAARVGCDELGGVGLMSMHLHHRDSIPRSAVRALRYPGEQWRFVLAAVMSTLWLIFVVLAIVSAGRGGSGLVEVIGGVFGAL